MTRAELAAELRDWAEYLDAPKKSEDEERRLLAELANRLACIASEIENE